MPSMQRSRFRSFPATEPCAPRFRQWQQRSMSAMPAENTLMFPGRRHLDRGEGSLSINAGQSLL